MFSSPVHEEGVYKGTSNDSVPVPVPKQIDTTNVTVGETVGSVSLSERGDSLSEQFLADELREQSKKLDTVIEDTSIIKKDTSEIKTSQASMAADVAEMKKNQELLIQLMTPGQDGKKRAASSSISRPKSTVKKTKQSERTHVSSKRHVERHNKQTKLDAESKKRENAGKILI